MQTVLVLEPFVSFKNSPAPVSRAFGDSNWVLAQEQKAIFSEENRELKKKVGGEWVRDILLSSLLFWPSLPRSLCLCCDGKDRNKPPLQVGVSTLSFLLLLSFCFSSLAALLCFALPVGYFPSESSGCFRRITEPARENERSWWSCSGTRGLNEIAAAQRRLNISLLMEELALKLFVGIFILHLFYLFFFGESDLKVISAHLCFPLMVSERLRWYFYCDVGRSVNDWALVLLTWSMLL